MPVNGSSNHRDHSICIHLSAVEFRDALAIHYEWPLMRMPATSICDGCGAPYGLVHAIDCKKGGLVTQRYEVMGWGRSSLAILRATNLCVRGSTVK